MLREEFLLRPPGSLETGRSSGRQQQHDSDLALVAVEERAKLVNPSEVLQHRRRRRSDWLRVCLMNRRRQCDRENECRTKMSRHV
jgi:hypothetical protein